MSENKRAEEYNELICEAIDTIVAARLSDLKFDKTIVCSITDASKADSGIYTVTDGSITFEALSDYTHYIKGNQVQVTIPSGDWSTQKRIIGRYSTDLENDPIVSVAPTEQVAELIPNIVKEQKEWGIIANGETQEVEICNMTNLAIDTQINDTICIKAKFKTLLGNYNITEGSYGLSVKLIGLKDNQEIDIDLTSDKDMFGRVYNFSDWVSQEQAYKLPSSLQRITGIKVVLKQFTDFKEINSGGEFGDLPAAITNNILTTDVEIYFGTNVLNAVDNTVKIYTNDSLNYTTAEEKTLHLTWYNKTKENKYIGFSDGKMAESADEIKYAKGQAEAPENDSQLYYYIEWLIDQKDGSFTYAALNTTEAVIKCEIGLLTTDVKAIIYCNGEKYESNIIAFENLQIANDGFKNLGITISLQSVAPGADIYPLYGEDNALIDSSEAYRNRKIKFTYTATAGQIDPIYWAGATVEWILPSGATMLSPIQNINYTLTIGEQGFKDGENNTIQYRIKDTFNTNYINNTIKCRITLKGHTIEAEKTFTFVSQGTFGTNYTLVVKPNDERLFDFTNYEKDATFGFSAALLDSNGLEVQDKKFTWKWYPTNDIIERPEALTFKEGYKYYALNVSTQHTWVGRQINLEKIYPITYSNSGEYYAQAPSEIIYDSFGKLQTKFSELKLYTIDGTEVSDVEWKIIYRDKNNNTVDLANEDTATLGLPSISTESNRYYLMIPNYYTKSNYYPVLAAEKGDKTQWYQPLIIQQYQYGSELLNNWDGALKIDKDNNTVLSGAGVFGLKGSGNTFSGVVLGEVGKIDDSGLKTTNMTGLIGYKDGAQAYAFKDDGTAFIGGSGAGRIEFDGNHGFIKSANWQGGVDSDGNIVRSSEQGMAIALSSGQIDARDFKLTSANIYLDSNPQKDNDNYFKIGNNEKYISLSKKGDLDMKVDTLQITSGFGGRNLLRMTAPTADEIQSDLFKQYWSVPYGSARVEKLSGDTENTIIIGVNGTDPPELLTYEDISVSTSKYYTISGYLRNRHTTSPQIIKAWIIGSNGEQIEIFNKKVGKQGSEYMSCVFKPPSSKISIKIESSGFVLGVYHMKLEMGTIATDWTSNDQDIRTSIEINQEGIKQTVALNGALYNFFETKDINLKSSKYSMGSANILWGDKFFTTSPFKYTLTVCATPGEGVYRLAAFWIKGASVNKKSFRIVEWKNHVEPGKQYIFTYTGDTIPEEVLTHYNRSVIGFYQNTEEDQDKITSDTTIHWITLTRDPLPASIESSLIQTANNMLAKVSNNISGNSCSWNLTEKGFYVNAGYSDANINNYVLKVDSGGLVINGSGTFTGDLRVGANSDGTGGF